MDDTSLELDSLSLNKAPVHKIPFSLWIVMFYASLFFIIFPLLTLPNYVEQNISVIGSSPSDTSTLFSLQRFPLFTGIFMLIVAFLTKKKLQNGILPILFFSMFGCFFILNGIFGPLGFFGTIRLLFAWAGMGICLFLILNDFYQFNFFLKFITHVALISAVYGLFFTFPLLTSIGNALISLGLPSGKDHYDWRLTGLGGDPSVCGVLLLFGFIILLNKVLDKLRYLDVFFCIILIISIFLTFSRTTWAGTLVATASLLSMKKYSKTRLLTVFILLLLVIFVFYHMVSFVIEENQFRWDIAHSDTRSGVWEYWLSVALEKPFGHGIGFIQATSLRKSLQVPHNIYLSFWIDGGIQVLLSFLCLLWLSFNRIWKLRKVYDPDIGLNYGPMLLSLLLGVSTSLFALSTDIQLIFIAIALCLSYCQLVTQETKSRNAANHSDSLLQN
jgi:hypothetical protein